jgi:hypothetical protein
MLRFFAVALALPTIAAAQGGVPAGPIADNSFLIEEAYNQERGVVQHISVFQRLWDSGLWAYNFTQEWPLWSQRHQLSFTVPLQRVEQTSGSDIGLGDVAINYRFQLAGTATRVSVSPRVSLVIPTGNDERGFGAGAAGVQLNLPVSVTVLPRLVAHLNAGAGHTPRARNTAGERAGVTTWSAGASAIWLLHPNMNLVVETVWGRAQSVIGPDQTVATETWVVNPGVRWALNFRNGLQIVPGLAFPLGVGPSAGEHSLLLYVSFEHPF